MAGPLHDRFQDRPAEDEALTRAMTSIDPLLRASLQREQTRRRWRWLLSGGLVMLTMMATWLVLTGLQAPPETDSADRSPGSKVAAASDDPVERAEQATATGQEGWQLWQSGDPRAAEAKFLAAIDLDGADPQHWNGLGWSRVHLQEYDEALNAFRECLKLDNNHPAALNGVGQVLLMQRKYVDAEKTLQRAAPRSSAALYGLARVQLLRGRFTEAIKTVAKLEKLDASEMDPGQLEAMQAAVKDKKLSPELKAKLEPPTIATKGAADAGKSNARGWQLFNSGKMRPAELAFREALKANPTFVPAKNGLAFCLLNQNKVEEAQPLFEELIQKDAKHAGYVNGLARCYAASGETQKAIDLWRTVDTADRPVTACTWGLARAYMELNQLSDALPYWERIAVESPDDTTVAEMIDKCRAAQ